MTDNVQNVWYWVLYEQENDNLIYQAVETSYAPDLSTFPDHLTYAELTQTVFESMEYYLRYKYNADGSVTEVDHVENMSAFERYNRDQLLKETDFWAVGDRIMTAEQTAYRQALRDVPAQSGFPDNIVWPTKP